MTFFIISFVAGLLTVLAPCVLPLLPVIVGGSLADGKVHIRRAIVVTAALGLSVIAFTFILKVSTLFINIPQGVWTWISAIIILGFGLITLFPELWDSLSKKVGMGRFNRSSNKMLAQGYQKQSFWGDVLVGASLGPVFSTCSPTYFVILATVLPASFLVGFVDLLAYTIGLCFALLVVALVGQKIVARLGIAADPKGWFKRLLGVIFILVAIAIATGADKSIEASILSSGFFDITRVEQKLLQAQSQDESSQVSPQVQLSTSTVTQASSTSSKKTVATPTFLTAAGKALLYKLAPEIVNPSGFINTGNEPITVSQFRGKKVVLLDIWTYSCINCQRTLPYVNQWYDKYAGQGLEIISIHTPEFAFEKVQKNVEDAVKRLGIKYPVVLDNDYSTWNALGNQYWPRKYLVDVDGYIVYDHIGEGEYDVTEKAIQQALVELHARLGDNMKVTNTVSEPAGAVALDTQKVGSPETYFGSARNVYLANGIQGRDGEQDLSLPQSVTTASAPLNQLYLTGMWNFQKEFTQSNATQKAPTSIIFKYNAKNVYIVASADPSIAPDGVPIDVYSDGVLQKTITIKENRLYDLIKGSDYGQHVIQIWSKSPGLQAFTFTFG